MILLDFRNWSFDNYGYLPNTKEELLRRDFETLRKISKLDVVDLGVLKPFKLSSLFFEDSKTIAVSPLKKVESFYKCIDALLEVKDKEVIDYTEAAEEEVYFYGKNSLVAHKESEIGLCGINSLSDESLFEEYCEDFELTPFSFEISDDFLTSDFALFVGNKLLICLEFIKDKKTKKDLFSVLKANKIEVISLTKSQVEKGILNLKFTGDMLLMTKNVDELFTDIQKEQLVGFNKTIIDLPFLEKTKIRLSDVII